MKIFVAGASGALGRPLMVQLLKAGHDVWGMAQRPESLSFIAELGACAVKGNVLDRTNIMSIMEDIRPDVVIDQLTSLPSSPFELAERLPADKKLRLEGGGNLHAAAHACGVKRYIQQSSGFYLNAENGGLADESSTFKMDAPGHIGESSRMYAALEKRVLESPMEGVALRYGFFYGPRTWYSLNGAFSQHFRNVEVPLIGRGSSILSFVHVEDAVSATIAALQAPAGIYNIVDDHPVQMCEWLSFYAHWSGAAQPVFMEESEATRLMGIESVYYYNNLDGASPQKAKKQLAFAPRVQPWVKQ
ncbi:NAD-dependent epimerase/dehydratase family protein [Swingsia samuiensis]|uniref:NAD(P)-dependent oxidoreductase n=1 Tax=Swingsia samuiensis TaxID=1293412 RepID=A0A4Y6UJG9_9PROT|nr:NAD(P)-dependent oxidoreductase [Swingsia samuiensis]QDH16507.1 NAD(P)-dependent oxidoreductase [Swingsia samuiensis]